MTNGAVVVSASEDLATKYARLEAENARLTALLNKAPAEVSVKLILTGETMFETPIKNRLGKVIGKEAVAAKTPMVVIAGRKNVYMSAWKFRRVVEAGIELVDGWEKTHGEGIFDAPSISSDD